MKNKVRLKRNNILKKSSEFIDLTADFNARSRVVGHKLVVALNLVGELFLLL
jgi:hypothetical protein